MSVVVGLSAPVLPAPKSVAQVPLVVAAAQLAPAITSPATLVMSTVPLVKVLLGLTVWALKLASVPLARVPTVASTIVLTISLLKVERMTRGRALADATAGSAIPVLRDARWADLMRPSNPAEACPV